MFCIFHKLKFVDVKHEKTDDYDIFRNYIKTNDKIELLFICEKCNKVIIKKFDGKWSEEKLRNYFMENK